MTESRETLVRAIGTFGLAAGIINITIGGGIFRLPANVAGSLGAAAPIAYLVCAAAMGLIVLCIADAGSRVSLTGGPYAYVGTAFGPYVGFLSGVLLFMLGTFATAAVSTVFAASIGLLVPALAGRPASVIVLVAAFAFWSLVNLRGVALSVRLNSIATVAKLLPLLLVADRRRVLHQRRQPARSRSMPPAGRRRAHLAAPDLRVCRHRMRARAERRGPRYRADRAARDRAGDDRHHRALHRAAGGGAGRSRRATLPQATASPLADAAGVSMGGWARTMLLAGASISTFGYLGGMTLSMPRMLFALARDGFLPRRAGGRASRSTARRTPPSSCNRCSRWCSRSPARSNSSRFSPTCRRWRCISAARWRHGGCVR